MYFNFVMVGSHRQRWQSLGCPTPSNSQGAKLAPPPIHPSTVMSVATTSTITREQASTRPTITPPTLLSQTSHVANPRRNSPVTGIHMCYSTLYPADRAPKAQALLRLPGHLANLANLKHARARPSGLYHKLRVGRWRQGCANQHFICVPPFIAAVGLFSTPRTELFFDQGVQLGTGHGDESRWVQHLHRSLVLPWLLFGEKLPQNNPKGVDVRLLVVGLALQHLGSRPLGRAGLTLPAQPRGVPHSRQPKITHLSLQEQDTSTRQIRDTTIVS